MLYTTVPPFRDHGDGIKRARETFPALIHIQYLVWRIIISMGEEYSGLRAV